MDTVADPSPDSNTHPVQSLPLSTDPPNQTHHQDQTAQNEFEQNYTENLDEELEKKVNLNVEEDWDGWNDVIENYGGENGRSEMESGEVGLEKVNEFSYENGENRQYGINYDSVNYNYNSGNYNYQTEDQNQQQFPVRPEAEDCAFYMKTGNCKFGYNCRFNHPPRRTYPVANEMMKEEDATDKAGQTECKYYLRTGGCKYGKYCRYSHSNTRTPVTAAKSSTYSVSELNFLGLPIRQGEKECPYYMRNGSCKYGSSCKFNHPDPISVGGTDRPPALGHGGSIALRNASQSGSSWSSPRALNEPAPFAPLVFSPNQRVPHNVDWNGYQASVYPPDRGIHPPQPYLLNNPMTDGNAYLHQQPQIVDEFPERPGQPECTYYMKTGDCKFRSNCKFHHPKSRVSKPSPCALSDKGLPLRPDQNICSHYSRYGICKFGPACKFNHPEDAAPLCGFSENRMADFDEIDDKEGAIVSEYGNRNAPAIQQSV